MVYTDIYINTSILYMYVCMLSKCTFLHIKHVLYLQNEIVKHPVGVFELVTNQVLSLKLSCIQFCYTY